MRKRRFMTRRSFTWLVVVKRLFWVVLFLSILVFVLGFLIPIQQTEKVIAMCRSEASGQSIEFYRLEQSTSPLKVGDSLTFRPVGSNLRYTATITHMEKNPLPVSQGSIWLYQMVMKPDSLGAIQSLAEGAQELVLDTKPTISFIELVLDRSFGARG